MNKSASFDRQRSQASAQCETDWLYDNQNIGQSK